MALGCTQDKDVYVCVCVHELIPNEVMVEWRVNGPKGRGVEQKQWYKLCEKKKKIQAFSKYLDKRYIG